jgi:hypothetical protein
MCFPPIGELDQPYKQALKRIKRYIVDSPRKKNHKRIYGDGGGCVNSQHHIICAQLK